MQISKHELVKMIDISAVKADSSVNEIKAIVNSAKEHHFICVFTLPAFAPYAKKYLGQNSDIMLGGTVGFPSGASSTSVKSLEAKELLDIGCHELDMVINIGKLKSKLYDDVAAEIITIVKIAGLVPLKVILETSLLNDYEIQEGAKIVRDCGAKFIKTGTGWNGITKQHHIEIIKQTVGEGIPLKVAGGVRDLNTLLMFLQMGVSRFGIGYQSAINIIHELDNK